MFRFMFHLGLVAGILFLAVSFSKADTKDSLRFEALDADIQQFLRTNPDTVRGFLREQRALLYSANMSSEMLEDLRPRNLNNHGVFFRRLSKLDSALHYFQLAYEAQDSSRNPSRMATIYNNLANVHFQGGDYPLALDHHFQALTIRRSLGDSAEICMSLGNIGLVYENLGEPDQALKYYEDALAFVEVEGSNWLRAWLYTSLGTLDLREGRLDEAEEYLRRSIAIKEGLEDIRGIGFSMTDLGAVYLQQYLNSKSSLFRDSASSCLERALAIHQSQENDFGTAATLNYLGELEMAAGAPARALEQLQEALLILRKRELPQEEARNLELQSQAHEMLGQFQRALTLHQEFKALNDSLFNVDRDKEIGRKEAWSEYQHKLQADQLRFEHELALKEEERQRKNLLIAVIGLSFLLALVGLGWLYSRWRRTRREKVLAEEEVELLAEVNRQIAEKNEELQGRIVEINKKLEQRTGELPAELEELTKREMEVLLSLGLGLTDKEIAERLFISIATVRTHNRKIFDKLQIRSRSEAVGLVHRYRLLAEQG